MRPGRAPASSTSKPVIVSHKPMIQDNSVTTNGVGEPRQLMNARLKISVKPADDEGSTPVSVTTPTPSTPQQVPAPVPAPAPVAPAERAHVPFATAAEAPAPMPAPAVPSTPVNPPAAENTPAAVEARDDLVVPQFQADAASHDDPLLDDMPQPVVDSEEPVVSKQIGPKTFPWKTTVLISIILLLAVVVIDVLLDGDFISWGIPHTHFF